MSMTEKYTKAMECQQEKTARTREKLLSWAHVKNKNCFF